MRFFSISGYHMICFGVVHSEVKEQQVSWSLEITLVSEACVADVYGHVRGSAILQTHY